MVKSSIINLNKFISLLEVMPTILSLFRNKIYFSFNETDNVSEIVVTWSTMDDAAESTVEYGINGFALIAHGESEKFVDGGNAKHSQYIHKVNFDFTVRALTLFDSI